jgi:hypothetical protein
MAKDDMHLSQWEVLRGVDRNFTKKITGKSYQGDSPNPTWMVMKLTELLGPIGINWGFEVKYDRIRLGRPHQIEVERDETKALDTQGEPYLAHRRLRHEIIREENHEVCIQFWRIAEGEKRTFDAFGGTQMLYLTSKGKWMHDEDAAKKSLTDAYTKAMSWMGVAADIYLALYDDKYQSRPVGRDDADDRDRGTRDDPDSARGPRDRDLPPADDRDRHARDRRDDRGRDERRDFNDDPTPQPGEHGYRESNGNAGGNWERPRTPAASRQQTSGPGW